MTDEHGRTASMIMNVRAIVKEGGPTAESRLLGVLEREDHPLVLERVAKGLAKHGSERSIQPLIPLTRAENWDVREESVNALVDIGLNAESEAAVIDCLKDPVFAVRLASMTGLSYRGSERAREVALDASRSEGFLGRSLVRWLSRRAQSRP